MAAQWEMLRVASETQDYTLATTTLLEELGYGEPTEILPFLKGVLAEVIRREDSAALTAQARRAKKGSAFGGFKAAVEEALPSAGPARQKDGDGGRAQEEDGATRRWRRTLRAVFSEEAATSMLTEFAEMYKSLEWARAAANTSGCWDAETNRDQRLADIRKCCISKYTPVLARYGFTPDERGYEDMKAILDSLAAKNKEIILLKMKDSSLVLKSFPDLDKAGASPDSSRS